MPNVRSNKATKTPVVVEDPLIRLERARFLSKLAVLKPAIASGGVIIELRHIWFDKGYAMAYDGGLGIRIPLDVGGITCGVPGATLLGLLGTSPLKEVELDLPDKKSLSVSFGSSHSKVAVLASDSNVWPFPAKEPSEDQLQVTEIFIEALRKALLVKAAIITRIENRGIIVEPNKRKFELYATDSASLVQVLVEEKNASFSERVLLPREFCQQLVECCPKGAALSIRKDYFAATTGEISIYSNVLDASGIADLRALANKHLKPQPESVALPVGLEGALSRAEILAGAEAAIVTISIKKNAMVLKGKYPYGVLDETLVLEGEHPDAEIKIDSPLLRRVLAQVDQFSISTEALALYGDGGVVYLISGHQ